MSKNKSDFMSFYSSGLLPVLNELELKRKEGLKKGYIAGAVIFAIGAGISFFLFGGDIMHGIIAIFLTIAAIYGAIVFFLRDFVREFKEKVISSIVTFISPDLKYNQSSHISRDKFRSSEIFTKRIDRYNGEDCVSGMVDKTQIEFSEIHAEEKHVTRDSKGRRQTRYVTIFKGLFFIADFNKEFKGLTLVLPDMAERTLGKFFGQAMQKMNISRKGELIKLEDVNFEKEFVVYGDDQVEARYILSPALMSRILEFRKKSKYEIHLSFKASKVYLAITTNKNMFEPPKFKSVVDFSIAKDYYEDFLFALGIVDELNLNTRIWTKE